MYVQISTIETRTDGLEQSSGGKKDKKDAGGPESAFAAFFAHAHQGARRESTARTVSHEPDAVAEDVRSVDSDQAETQASAAGKQEVKSKQPTAPVNATQHVEADTSGAEETADAVEPESTIVSAPEAKQLRSHVKYSVLPANGKALETTATATDAQVSKAVASALNVSDIAVRTTVKEATAKPVALATNAIGAREYRLLGCGNDERCSGSGVAGRSRGAMRPTKATFAAPRHRCGTGRG